MNVEMSVVLSSVDSVITLVKINHEFTTSFLLDCIGPNQELQALKDTLSSGNSVYKDTKRASSKLFVFAIITSPALRFSGFFLNA